MSGFYYLTWGFPSQFNYINQGVNDHTFVFSRAVIKGRTLVENITRPTLLGTETFRYTTEHIKDEALGDARPICAAPSTSDMLRILDAGSNRHS